MWRTFGWVPGHGLREELSATAEEATYQALTLFQTGAKHIAIYAPEGKVEEKWDCPT